MAFKNPWIAALGPADARAAALFLQIRLPRRNAVHRQRQPPRRREGLCAFIDQALGDQLVGHHAAQIIRRLRLHARGDFLGEQFEAEDRASMTLFAGTARLALAHLLPSPCGEGSGVGGNAL